MVEHGDGPLYYGVVMADDSQNLGFAWLAIPTIVKWAAAAAAASGVFVLADAWLEGRRIEGEANLAHQLTRQRAMDAVASAAKVDPGAALKLAEVLKRADEIASTQGTVGRLLAAAGAVADAVATGVKKSADWLPIVALLALSRWRA